MADNIVINANTPGQATMRTTNTAGVHTPHSMAEVWVSSNPATNTNPVPVLAVLANGTPLGSGANGLNTVEQNSANILIQVANTVLQVANVAAQVANGLHTSAGLISNSNPLPVVSLDAGSIGTNTFNRGATGVLFSVDTTGYESISVQVTNSGNSSIVGYYVSDDNTNWVNVNGTLLLTNNALRTVVNFSSTVGMLAFGTRPRYFMANVVTYVGTGNVQGLYVMRQTNFVTDTSAVPTLVNPAGSLNRMREAGFDNMPSQGISRAAKYLTSPILTSNVTSGAIVANTTLGNTQFANCAVSFTNRGVTQSIQNNSIVLVDPTGTNAEYVTVVSSNSTGIVANFTLGHANAVGLQTFSYSQMKDATIPDGALPQGVSAAVPFSYNPSANSGTGGVEAQRNNIDPTANLLTFTASNTSANSADQTNYNHRGVICYLGVTSNSGAVNATVTVYNKDPVSGLYFSAGSSGLLQALSAANSAMFTLYPGMTAGVNANNGVVSRTFKLGVAFAGTGNITGRLTYSLIV